MKTTISLAVLLAAAVAFIFFQSQSQKKLRADTDSLAQQVAQLQSDNENLSKQLTAAQEPHPLADKEKTELMKLRGEVDSLHRQLGQASALRAENARLRAQPAAAATEPANVTPEEIFELRRIHTVNTLKQIELANRIFAGDNNDHYATNFDQLTADYLGTNFVSTIAKQGLSLDNFEFVNVGAVSDTMPDVIAFRERVPRVDANGNWERVYGMADGSVNTIHGGQQGDETRFTEFERQHAPHPAGQ